MSDGREVQPDVGGREQLLDRRHDSHHALLHAQTFLCINTAGNVNAIFL